MQYVSHYYLIVELLYILVISLAISGGGKQ